MGSIMAVKCLFIMLATPSPSPGCTQTIEPLLCANQEDILSCHVVSEAVSSSPFSPFYSDHSSIVH